MSGRELLIATLEYGQGYDRMVDQEKKNETPTKIYDCTTTLGHKFLNYHLHKIHYELKSNEYIQSIKMEFKNRNDGHIESLIDTEPKDEKKNEFELEENEEIKIVRIWVDKDRLTGFELTTTKNKVKMIGYEKNGVIKISELEDGNKIVFGFGFNANKQYGVSSIFCYYMDKRKYGIVRHNGLLLLRSKLKKNPSFKAELEAKRSSLDELKKLILDTCDLADTAFFPIASYVMSY